MSYKSKFTGEEIDSLLTEVQEGKGGLDPDGYYPSMSVGFADDLVGRGESVPAEYSFRASGGKSIKDGTARIKRLKGNSVVWNNIATAGKLNNDTYIAALPQGARLIANHKYIILIEKLVDANLFLYANDGNEKEVAGTGTNAMIFTSSVSVIGNGQSNSARNLFWYCLPKNNNGYAENIRLVDLTQMFQAGNEPTTIEEYEARKPIVADEYAYNEGEIIHMTAEGVKSIGDNAWDEECERGSISEVTGEEYDIPYFRTKNYIKVLPNTQYYFKKPKGVITYLYFYDADNNYVGWLDPFATTGEGGVFTTMNAPYMRFVCYTDTYNHDITISLYHSGWKQDTDAKYQPYWEDRLMFDKRIKDEFPDGMSKWDMVYNKNGKGQSLKGMSVVDMGSLNWYYDASLGGFYSDTLVGAKKFFDGICAKYPFAGDYRNVTDKTCGFVYELCVLVKDSSYTDAASLKASLAGVPLYYQLAEPTAIEYDEPFNLDYRVADFGTEEIIAEQPSAPISADIIYQFNAVDMIREHELEITELQRIIATMQAQLTSLTSNNGGQ